MSHYSLDDTCELAAEIDTLRAEDIAVDSFARDCDDFDRDIHADSLDEYLATLLAEADTHNTPVSERATAPAHVRANAERDARVQHHARDAFNRYVERFVHDGYAPGVSRFIGGLE